MLKQLIVALATFLLGSAAHAAEKTYVFDMGGFATALERSREVIGKLEGLQQPPALVPKNAVQEDVAQHLYYSKELHTHMKPGELTVVASSKEEEINRILEEAKSRIRIKFRTDDRFAVVSVLNVGIDFVKPGDIAAKDEKTGKVSYFDIGGKPAMRFALGNHAIEMRQMDGSKEPLIKLTAKNGDVVVLHRTDDRHASPAMKEVFAKKLLDCAAECREDGRYLGAIVPMVLVDQDVDEAEQIVGLSYAGTDWYVSQAKQQVRYFVDPKGATVKTETVVVNATRSSRQKEYYRLDGGFYAVMLRPGMSFPYFSGWVSPTDFNVPPTYKLPEGWMVSSKTN